MEKSKEGQSAKTTIDEANNTKIYKWLLYI